MKKLLKKITCKKLFKNRSKLLFIVSIIEGVFSLWFLSYFNYIDRLGYTRSVALKTNDLALLLEDMYTSTWWALIILVLILITIFAIIAFIYRDVKFQLISIILWCVLLLLGINLKDSIFNNISTILIFVPIIIANIFAYRNQKKLS